MPEHLKEAGYPGQIDIGGDRSPVTYKLKARKEDDGAFHVAVSLSAPRDWLLKHGFRREATLVRQGGVEMPIHFEETLNVADNISVTLRADDAVMASMDELRRAFPELRPT
ncbi:MULTISPECIES: hypothetical protein [unclassified Neorhizobium]|uniref:hypothetical protein n=1 Tax=unclassified Neorhizobium TaxID=2629175 RepID=UPI001FF4B367|nr:MULTISPECIES: hypothetical protein [unclassified Neorhizobium]MCJ9673945.1 hypothetical protein [Neorhizobium sp. SHOUNA12B]MCJ9745767.1 hypothetical protein [Neorhizobium sp. SHOUNA12A]